MCVLISGSYASVPSGGSYSSYSSTIISPDQT